MAVDYAEKYSQQVDERFKLQSLTDSAVNSNYDFLGVQTIKIYDIPTVAMADYTITGNSRYGTPNELGASTQELKMTQDRSFTFTIDRKSSMDTQGAVNAGAALSRQINEVVVPEIDKYRLSVMAANAGRTATGVVDKSNAYDAILDAGVHLTNNKCPIDGRIAFVSPRYYKTLKLDGSFIMATEIAQNMLIKGQVGMVDSIKTILIPDSYFPEGVEFIVTHQIATIAAQKLAEYKIHDNPPGINGWLIEGRIYYDAFVLKNKKNVIYVHKTA